MKGTMKINTLLKKETKIRKQIKRLTNKASPLIIKLKKLEKKHEETSNQIDWFLIEEEDKHNLQRNYEQNNIRCS